MKRVPALVVAGLLAVSVCGTAVYANCGGEACGMDKGGHMGKMDGKWQEKRLEKLEKELNLTAEQKAKIAAILKETGEKAKAEMEKVRETVKSIRDEGDQGIKAILTPEQSQKYDKIQQERQAKMEKKMKKMQKKMQHCK